MHADEAIASIAIGPDLGDYAQPRSVFLLDVYAVRVGHLNFLGAIDGRTL